MCAIAASTPPAGIATGKFQGGATTVSAAGTKTPFSLKRLRRFPGAEQLSAGKVLFHRDQLPSPEAGRLVTFCQSGLRNSVAASALRRAGHEVVEVEGSYAGWARWAAENQSATTP